MNSTIESVSVDKLLSEQQRATLSKSAQAMYQRCWNGMQIHGKTVLHWTDNQAARIARIELRLVPGAKEELNHAGLLLIVKANSNNGGEVVYRYQFVADDE